MDHVWSDRVRKQDALNGSRVSEKMLRLACEKEAYEIEKKNRRMKREQIE